MKPRRSSYFLAGALALGAGAGAWWTEAKRAIVLDGLAGQNETPAGPEELRQRILSARQRAAGWRGGTAALAELSRLAHANGFPREARQAYAALERLEPKEPRWPHRHAVLLAEAGESEAALAKWERVRELAPDFLPAQVRLGDLRFKTNSAGRAAEAYRRVLQRSPEQPHAALGLARIDLEAGRWAGARTRLEQIVAQTNYALGYDLIVTVYEHFGETARAADVRARGKASGAYREIADPWLEELMEDCYDSYRLTLEGGWASRRGESARARQWLERAMALAPGEVEPRFQLANVLAAAGDETGARREWERCTEIAPEFADAWAQGAAARQRAGDGAAATRMVAAGLRACPESPGLWLMRARHLREAGNAADAVRAYETAIRFRTNEADAFLELATTLFRMERVEEGLKRLEQGLAAEPEHPPTLALLALHAIGSGDAAGARAWMERVQRQPRVARDQVTRLQAMYREQFGREAPK